MLLLLRQQPIVYEVGVHHHGDRRSAKEERGCGQSVINQPSDQSVDVLHDFLFRLITYRTEFLPSVKSQAQSTAPSQRFSGGGSMLPTDINRCKNPQWVMDLDRAIDVTL
jgi:hypothetical protein